MKKGIFLVFVVISLFCYFDNPANALIVNFDVSGNAIQWESQIATFSGTAILDVDDIPLEYIPGDPVTGTPSYNNCHEIFNSFTINLIRDSGQTYSGSISFNEVGFGGNQACPMDTYLTLNNFGWFHMLGLGDNEYFHVGELLSEAFLPSWCFSAGDVSQNIWLTLNFTESSTPVPEPASILLIGSGLLGLAGFRKKLIK